MVGRSFKVLGRVQGVGFRAYVQRVAVQHKAVGEVWNDRAGAVRVLVFHEDEEVHSKFLEMLKRGPGRVDQVLAEPAQAQLIPEGFFISETR